MRVIGADGAQAGVMSRFDALQLALGAELDLVEVSPTAEPPVVRAARRDARTARRSHS